MVPKQLIAGKPEDVGIDSEKLEGVFLRAQKEVRQFGPNSVQVAVARFGKVAGLRTFGSAVQGAHEQPCTNDTLYVMYSCTKGIIAAAVWVLLEDGLLSLDERVAGIIPEFATNGKDAVTVEQVLLHTAGFPRAPLPPRLWQDRDGRLEAFSTWRLTSEPGSAFAYHATSAHWVLAEIIERRTGIDFRAYVRDRVAEPMGLPELFVGLPGEFRQRVARVRYVVEPVEPPDGWGEVTPEAVMRFADPEHWPTGVPGAGGIAGASELALFYQVLINGGEAADGRRVLKRETIDFATRVRTEGRHRDAFGVPVNRALSMIVAGDDGNAFTRGFGRTAGPRAIGHNGAGGQIAWGDPDSGISLGFVTSGFTDWRISGRRTTALSSLAAACAI
jgi:CubicO group peptidase (beta-lactamase class C family)